MLEHPEQKGMLCMEYNPDTRDVVLKSISLGHERAQTPANDIHPAGKLSSDMTRAATL